MVIRKCDFKTFNSSLPRRKGSSVNVPPHSGAAPGSGHRWGIFKWPQLGEFGWPPGISRQNEGPSLYCAVIVKRVDEQTRSKTSVNELLRD
jgi:hypothetical protein